MSKRLLRHKILALNINRENPINLLAMYLAQRPEMLNPRVTHDDVDPAEFALDHLEHGSYFGFGGDVGLHGEYADVVGADLGCDGVGGGGGGLRNVV